MLDHKHRCNLDCTSLCSKTVEAWIIKIVRLSLWRFNGGGGGIKMPSYQYRKFYWANQLRSSHLHNDIGKISSSLVRYHLHIESGLHFFHFSWRLQRISPCTWALYAIWSLYITARPNLLKLAILSWIPLTVLVTPCSRLKGIVVGKGDITSCMCVVYFRLSSLWMRLIRKYPNCIEI